MGEAFLLNNSQYKSFSFFFHRHLVLFVLITYPIVYSESVEKDGEVLFGKYCVHCHGATGAGDGKVGAKLPGPPPAYNGALKNLPEGKIFHSITYGKGTMGSHASQLTQEERWKLVYYVQKLQGPKTVAVDSTAKVATVTATVEPAKH